jgi:predicted RNase H-like nuclease (RuvC/YqgF family)
MARKPNKKNAILEYVKNNPNAKNSEVAKACGVHHTYASFIRRNDGVKTPKKPEKTPAAKPDFVFKQDFPEMLVRQINALREENEDLKDALMRMDGVIKYLENKMDEDATSV